MSSTAITNADLLEKCREFIVANAERESLDENIKNALITANREISEIGEYQPLAWMRQSYDGLFTKVYAVVSDITQADPAVITAESQDTNIDDDHGFVTDDIVFINGINGMERLNDRYYTATRASATTLTLKQLDAQNAINTTATTGPEVYQEYDSGGYIYHAGIKLPASTIEPTAALVTEASYQWKIKRVWNVMFDSYPSYPISEEAARSEKEWNLPGGRPARWRYFRRSWAVPTTYDHFVMFHPMPGQLYNVTVNIEKSYPDLSVWKGDVYPPHPPEVHDYIWQWALDGMSTNTEKQRREIQSEQRSIINTKIEVLNAQKWALKKIENIDRIRTLSKQMLGEQTSSRGLSA